MDYEFTPTLRKRWQSYWVDGIPLEERDDSVAYVDGMELSTILGLLESGAWDEVSTPESA